MAKANTSICSEDGCKNEPHSRGLCGKHYQRYRLANSSPCKIVGCESPSYSKGLCHKHYQLKRRTGEDARSCETCGASLEGKARRVRFCSEDCKPRCSTDGCGEPYYYRNGLCTNCGALYAAKGSTTANFRHTKKADKYTCLACGETFEHGQGAGRKFCCEAHKLTFYRYDGDVPSLDFDCSVCGEHFSIDRWEGGRAPKARKVCTGCATGLHRGGYREAFPPEYLAERDGTDCGVCGEPVDLSLKWPLRMSPSVDHIIPVSLGGTDDGDNLRLAHLSCNCARGNRMEEVPA